jgi:ATP-dependent DNA helicase RecQ
VRPAIVKVRVTKPQKLMQNSKQQAANIRGAYQVEPALISTDPVFLVDDIVDSRWTMAVVGEQLRKAGSGPVFPVALAGSF